MTKHQRPCRVCTKHFRPTRPWQVYCSRRCANRYNQREYLKRLKQRAALSFLSGDKHRKGLASETPEYTG